MPLINPNNIPFIKEGNIEWKTESSITSIRNWKDSHYYLIEFFDGKSLALSLNALNESLLTDIRNGKTTLVLSNTHEAFHSVVFPIYQFFVFNLSIPEKQILLLSESANIDLEVINVAKKLNKDTIRVEWTRIFENSIKNEIIHNPSQYNTLENKTYKKKFLNFNRRWRPHRPVFVALLACENILDLGYVSLALSDDNKNWNNSWDIIIYSCNDNVELIDQLNLNKDKILSLPNLYIDRKDLKNNHVNMINSSRKFYADTYFSVVSETNFYERTDPGQFVSEKTFKPIAEKHPFILISRPGCLQKLKSLGYKTFSPFINEDYDIETNDSKRMRMIVNEVIRLSNLNTDDLNYFLSNIKEICEYNYNILLNKTDFTTNLL
jgi:hypothetical protein